MIIHTVRKNESLFDIAREYCISPTKLAAINGLSERDKLAVGEELLVLLPTRTYNVKRGDTLEKIGARFGTRSEEMVSINPELQGRDFIYDGLNLAVKYDTPRYGTAGANGYFYRGCGTDALIRALPYLSLVTVCTAGISEGKIRFLMNDKELPELIKSRGKAALMRIYINSVPKPEETKSLTDSIAILALSRGYAGVALSKPKQKYVKEELCQFVLGLKKRLMECDLWLFVESDAEEDCSHTEYADGCVLFYDKLHKEKLPSFNEGERAVFSLFAENYEPSRAFIDLSPFAYYKDRYITKEEMRKVLLRTSEDISYDKESLTLRCDRAGRKKETLLAEGLENTKAKLELVSEYGFMGISFDIMRTPIKELIMFKSMFSIAQNPYMFPKMPI